MITIITPTYNRANFLTTLYNSLKLQTCKTFEWIIIDDGSSDHTLSVVDSFFSEKKLNIMYIYQENKGKHFAINNAVQYVTTDLVFIVDSDDFLVSNAIGTIISDWDKHKEEVIGLSYLRKHRNGNVIGDVFEQDYDIQTFEKVRLIDQISGDKAEVWTRDVLYTHPFLEFIGENFFSEQHAYLSISGAGKMLFRNEAIYVTEYLENGLSNNIRILQWNNPYGALTNAIQAANPDYGFKQRLKSFILIIVFSLKSRTNLLRNLYIAEYGVYWLLLSPVGVAAYITYGFISRKTNVKN